MFGFVRVAAASTELNVGDILFNTKEIIKCLDKANSEEVDVICFPELSITGYTCEELFFQPTILNSAIIGINTIAEYSKQMDMLIVVGAPIEVFNSIYNCAVAIQKGDIIGIVPKTFLPNNNEFYEKRYFASGINVAQTDIIMNDELVPFGTDLIFECDNVDGLTVGIEICEDLFSPISPSAILSQEGATVILNLSASNELVGKMVDRRLLVSQHSSKLTCTYVYANASMFESTTDLVFSGHSLIYENGTLLSENLGFTPESTYITADTDVELLCNLRRRNCNFPIKLTDKNMRKVFFKLGAAKNSPLQRFVNAMPFIPDQLDLRGQFATMLNIQSAGIYKRLKHLNTETSVIGVSGGLDSTLALICLINAYDMMKISRSAILGITMPGLGTTDRTYQNAVHLMDKFGISHKEIPIKGSVMKHFEDIGHDSNNHNVVYENAQARERTQILMDVANMENGIVIGTGDLSEIALGFSTYNGDHMSMYAVNAGIPKTLVKALINFCATENMFGDEISKLLSDVVSTPVSPELLPHDDGEIKQKTEDIIGPYELHDFFLYNFLHNNYSPKKICMLAQYAFYDKYPKHKILEYCKIFFKRFFAQQFKRNCMPDGPKVCQVGLSPRGDFRMGSDISSAMFLQELDEM